MSTNPTASFMMIFFDEEGSPLEPDAAELKTIHEVQQHFIQDAKPVEGGYFDWAVFEETLDERLRAEHGWDGEFEIFCVPMSCMTPLMLDAKLLDPADAMAQEIDEDDEDDISEDEQDEADESDGTDPLVEAIYVFARKAGIRLPQRKVVARAFSAHLVQSFREPAMKFFSANKLAPEELGGDVLTLIEQTATLFDSLYVEVNGEPIVTIMVED